MTMATIELNNIGIIGIEAYFPRYYVEQKELGKLIEIIQFNLIIFQNAMIKFQRESIQLD